MPAPALEGCFVIQPMHIQAVGILEFPADSPRYIERDAFYTQNTLNLLSHKRDFRKHRIPDALRQPAFARQTSEPKANTVCVLVPIREGATFV